MSRVVTTSLVWIIATLPVLATLSCGPKVTQPKWDSAVSADPEVEAAFRDARDLFSKGELGEADEQFARIIELHPQDPLARVSTVYRARIALALGNPSRARQLLAALKEEADPVGDRAKLYEGVALYQEKAYDAAIAILAPLQDKMTDPEENTELLSTLWKSASAAGKRDIAVQTIDRLLVQSTDAEARREATNALKKMIAAINDIDLLEEMAVDLPDENSAWPILMARIAEIHLEAGRFKESADVLDAIEARRRTDEGKIQEIADEVASRTEVVMDTVGLLVPLSGRSRLVGETVVKGAMIEANQTGINIAIRDTRGEPDRAAEMVEELVEKEHVFAIAGPLDVHTARAAAEKAEALGTPILLLAIRDDLTQIGGCVFRDFPSNRIEIQALLAAAKGAGHSRVAVLYPDNGFGKTLYALAAMAAGQIGMEIVERAVYADGSTSFQVPAASVAEAKPDAVLLLDKSSRIALIAPALAAQGIWSVHPGEAPGGPGEPVQLLIPSFGFSPDLVRRAGRYLNGALFSLYYEPSVTPDSQDFARRYHLDYGKQPNYLSAFGHDAIVILHGAAKSGAKTREAIREWLSGEAHKHITRLNTITPFAGFSSTGEPVAEPWIVELYQGEFVEAETR
jgi:branched-chain amino acid transport system substrate-binding protein